MPKENISFTYQEEEYIFSYENISEDIVIHRKYFERISESKAKLLDHNQAGIRVELDEIILSAQITKQNDLITVNLGKGDVCFKINPRFADPNEVSIEGGLVAPMPGKILKIMNKKGAKVKAGDTLIILEAMKMEHTIKASDQGIISDLFVKVGDQVENGSLLMKID